MEYRNYIKLWVYTYEKDPQMARVECPVELMLQYVPHSDKIRKKFCLKICSLMNRIHHGDCMEINREISYCPCDVNGTEWVYEWMKRWLLMKN
jgi:hypothetical protein